MSPYGQHHIAFCGQKKATAACRGAGAGSLHCSLLTGQKQDKQRTTWAVLLWRVCAVCREIQQRVSFALRGVGLLLCVNAVLRCGCGSRGRVDCGLLLGSSVDAPTHPAGRHRRQAPPQVTTHTPLHTTPTHYIRASARTGNCRRRSPIEASTPVDAPTPSRRRLTQVDRSIHAGV